MRFNLLWMPASIGGVFCLSTCLFLNSLLYAQDPELKIPQETDPTTKFETLSLEELMNIIVITAASNVVSEKEKQPVSVTTITRKQLQLSGARTLSEAIMTYVPGFFSVEDQDDLIAGFRGLAPDNNSKVMLLVNGQNLNTEWFWGPPDALLNSVNFDYIQQVDVIRGPGSVTLGQGALLGVINIITRKGSDNDLTKLTDGRILGTAGANDFYNAGADVRINNEGVQAYFHAASSSYNGQKLRNEGWAKDKANEGFKGGNVFDIGTRLGKAKNNTFISNVGYKGFDFNLIFADQERDLYNFYRDRNRFRQTMTSIGTGYKYSFSENLQTKINLNYTVDNFALSSVNGPAMGGTRENRFDATAIININDIITKNKLAIGGEFRRFGFGRKNLDGINFIANVIDETALLDPSTFMDEASQNKVMGYHRDLSVWSLFAEDYHTINDKFNLFAAVRFDNHPFWGTNLSPRIGTLVSPNDNTHIRLSYQTGFRGAVGLHYSGGYRQDGFLRADNYDAVSAAQIPIYNDNNEVIGYESNINKVKPERMQSLEGALNIKMNKTFSFEMVTFYNIIKNVIDVGVIYRDPSQFILPSVGSDVPGDWNGYWYFKNSAGTITQYGSELSIRASTSNVNITVSHSLVKVSSFDDQQRGSMYLSNEGNFKAYPENVTRLNIIATPVKNFSIGLHGLYYYSWYSPRDQKAKGNLLANLSGTVELTENLEASFIIRNLLGQTRLYPMNSNAGGADLSDGTPVVEKTNMFFRLVYKF